MRQEDLFRTKKDIHIKLDRDVHYALRMKMFELNLNMQDVFNEFARLVVKENKRAMKIINAYKAKCVREELKRIESAASGSTRPLSVDIDQNALYDMIEEKKENK